MNTTINEALVSTRDADGDWGLRLRASLDDAGVTDVERMAALRERLEDARELLACTSFDGTQDTNAEEVASALDKMLDAADSLAVALEELAAVREP